MFRTLLKRLAESLDRAGVRYMVFGGQAVLLHGELRVTRDIDILLGIEPDEAATILAMIRELGLQVLVSDVENFLRDTFVLPVMDRETGIRVDFVFSLSAYECQALHRATSVVIDAMKVRFVSVEDLIVQKIVAGRPRDLEDVKTVFLKNPDFDRAYVEKWLKEFDQELDSQFFLVYEQIAAELA